MNNTATNFTDSQLCAKGCGEHRAPAPRNTQFKQSKYCPHHKLEAAVAFRTMISAKPKASDQYAKFQAAWDAAEIAGMNAGQSVKVTPMVVQQHVNMLDDSSPVAKQYIVEGGACGFAWVKIQRANSSFAKWAVKTGKTAKGRDYDGGLTVKWVSEFGQSMTRKEAYAAAFAGVLQEQLGINVHAYSRMD